jgi:hypothetical protein
METLTKTIENLGTAGALMIFEPVTSRIQARGINSDSDLFSTVCNVSHMYIDLPKNMESTSKFQAPDA